MIKRILSDLDLSSDDEAIEKELNNQYEKFYKSKAKLAQALVLANSSANRRDSELVVERNAIVVSPLQAVSSFRQPSTRSADISSDAQEIVNEQGCSQR